MGKESKKEGGREKIEEDREREVGGREGGRKRKMGGGRKGWKSR